MSVQWGIQSSGTGHDFWLVCLTIALIAIAVAYVIRSSVKGTGGAAHSTTIVEVLLRCSRALGAVLLILAIVLVSGQVMFVSGATRTPGVVVGNRTVPDDDGFSYAPVVEFVNGRGEKETYESHISTNPPAFRDGQEVTVRVSVDGRRKAINTFGQLWLSSVILGGGLLGFSGHPESSYRS